MGLRDWQPARLRAHRHGRRRQLPRTEAVRHEPRQLHPDRRGDQFREQRRSADQRAGRGDWHQCRDQLAGEQHRICGADQRRERRAAAVARTGSREPRLHGRRPARRGRRPRAVAETADRSRRPRAGHHGRSPADRAGVRPYDVITSLDDRTIANDDQLSGDRSRAPGSAARLHCFATATTRRSW